MRALGKTTLTDADLIACYADAPTNQWWVRLNFVATVDGSPVGADGLSGSINTDADHVVFDLLRAWADVILVGSGTVSAEGYGPPQTAPRFAALRAGRPANPAMAVLSRSGQLPEGFERGGREDVFAVDSSGPDGIPGALRLLRERGYRHVLCEGGPTIASALASAGLIDEFCMTMSPVIVQGDAPRFLHGDGHRQPLVLRSLVEHEGTLLTLWGRS